MRLRDWQSRLQALIAERESMPLAWGTNDCCIFACDAVLAMTGEDPAAGLREHRNEVEAAELLTVHGGVMQLADARLGERIRPALAQVGDVGLVDTPLGPGLAVWGGSQWLGPGANGLVRLPFEAARVAWRGECHS